jgi:hypothetical protein
MNHSGRVREHGVDRRQDTEADQGWTASGKSLREHSGKTAHCQGRDLPHEKSIRAEDNASCKFLLEIATLVPDKAQEVKEWGLPCMNDMP